MPLAEPSAPTSAFPAPRSEASGPNCCRASLIGPAFGVDGKPLLPRTTVGAFIASCSWRRYVLPALGEKLPTAAFLQLRFPSPHQWTDCSRYSSRANQSDPPFHRSDIPTPEAASHLVRALEFPRFLVRDRAQSVREMPELDSRRRAAQFPLPVDPRCSAPTQGAFLHSAFAQPVAAHGAHRVRIRQGRQPRPRLQALPRPLSC